jgi:multidrug resistance efflux pump
MSGFTIALIVIGAAILIGVLIQFRLLSPKGIIFAVAAIGAVAGLYFLQGGKRRALLKELKNKEKELKVQEKRLDELEKQHTLSNKEVQEAQDALEREKAKYQKQILLIDTEKEKIKAEKEKKVKEIMEMTPQEVIDDYVKKYG